jgi:hypothetical protein
LLRCASSGLLRRGSSGLLRCASSSLLRRSGRALTGFAARQEVLGWRAISARGLSRPCGSPAVVQQMLQRIGS